MFAVFTLIVAVSALLSFLNHRFLKLPQTIGVLIMSIVVSLLLASVKLVNVEWFQQACHVVTTLDFRSILFDFLLSFLLFAGAIHVNLKHLLEEKGPVILFATLGVMLSTFIAGSLVFVATQAIGLPITYMQCLVFGALISPTDPVAVLSLLQKANVSKKLEIKVIGESLFNDGVGIVVFLTLLALAGGSMAHGGEVSAESIAETLLVEAGGGLLMGWILGRIGVYFLRIITDEPVIEVHVTLAVVMGGYALSSFLGVSGALAMVVAGLIIGHRLSMPGTPKEEQENLYRFWGILDEVLNAVLFVLIGVEILVLGFDAQLTIMGLLAIVIVLVARFISINIANRIVPKSHRSSSKEVIVLTWAGLRGGISIALAFWLSESLNREPILYITYMVVVFSIIVQGLTIEKVVKRLMV